MKGTLANFFKKPQSAIDPEGSKQGLPSSERTTEESVSQPEIIKASAKIKTESGKENGQADSKKSVSGMAQNAVDVPKKLDYRAESTKMIESEDYDAVKHAPFVKGQHSPFFFICECFELVATMKGQNSVEKKKRILINMFKTLELLKPEEVADFYLFSTGRLDAEYLQEDLGIGGETRIKAAAFAVGANKKNIKEDVDKVGDLGDVLEERKSKTQTVDTYFSKSVDTKRLTFQYIFDEIKKFPKYTGQKEKESILQALLYECRGKEAKFVIRFLQSGNFKMGCAKATIQSSLARSYYEIYSPKSEVQSIPEDWEKALQKCSHQYPNYKLIIKGLQESKGDPNSLYKSCHLTPGIPCKPMLAKPTKDIRIIFTRFDGKPFTCEYKYDGLRGQIHYTQGKLLIYSRNLENMTAQYPDVAKNILESITPDTKEFIVDSEIVGMDHNTVTVFYSRGRFCLSNY